MRPPAQLRPLPCQHQTARGAALAAGWHMQAAHSGPEARLFDRHRHQDVAADWVRPAQEGGHSCWRRAPLGRRGCCLGCRPLGALRLVDVAAVPSQPRATAERKASVQQTGVASAVLRPQCQGLAGACVAQPQRTTTGKWQKPRRGCRTRKSQTPCSCSWTASRGKRVEMPERTRRAREWQWRSHPRRWRRSTGLLGRNRTCACPSSTHSHPRAAQCMVC